MAAQLLGANQVEKSSIMLSSNSSSLIAIVPGFNFRNSSLNVALDKEFPSGRITRFALNAQSWRVSFLIYLARHNQILFS